MAEPSADDLTVYYDGSCPLCRREIALYRGRARADFVDVSDPKNLPADLSAPAAMARFHVRDGGRLVSGAMAFAALWRATPRLRTLGRIAQAPGVSSVLEASYAAFLRVRPALQRLVRRRADEASACR